ncbi:translation initiation factor IF-3 [Crocosphaera sp. UHCC 0190]|uniref:translation initiation factor IF-3 n=1 Tax=Crocosphaera sp. UHCC 0190 TaxID=3110246 RepID=UPI002B2174E1|nr:translation initiation factor IF-3 [Crocosphaera sp. UHCC 0190]MEA5508869.1 translation initiation factor IF-3 [Crocosphaera sp. UHCC 0190]
MRRAKTRNKPVKPFEQSDQYRVNHRIKAQEVRVISEDGQQLGIQSLQEALSLAEQAELDLVEVSPNASPAVCKIIDYGKFKYQLQKKEAQAKKNRTETSVKELQLRYCIDTGDLDTKLNQARKFLKDGCKVKFSMRFRGRERAFIQLGREKLEQIVERLRDVANLEGNSSYSGNQLHIFLEPN